MHITTTDHDWGHERQLWLDDETAACRLAVLDYTIRVGTAQTSMAGIGGVHTEHEHRMKGYMRRLFEDTVTYMVNEGYDISMLYGIPNFYTKFGYATCLAKHRFTIKTRDAEVSAERAGSYDAGEVTAEDMPEVVNLYNEINATRTCTAARHTGEFERFKHGTNWGTSVETRLWRDGDGRLLGYVVWDRNPTAVRVAEVGARDDVLFPTILAALAAQAVEKRCEEITVYAPPDDAFAEYAQRFGIEWTIQQPRYSDGMARILNQRPFLDKLLPELARRLSGFASAIPVALETDLGTVTLVPGPGTVTLQEGAIADARLALSQDKLVQLALGYRSVRDVINSPDVTLTGDALETLDALFPRQVAFMWRPDYF